MRVAKGHSAVPFPGEIVKDLDVTFLFPAEPFITLPRRECSRLWCKGRAFTLIGSHRYDHDWHWLPHAFNIQDYGHLNTNTHRQDEGTTSEHQYCGTVCYSYRSRDSHSVEIQATKTHLFSADCTQTILFISCVCVQVREKSAFWKIDLMLIVKVK